jgi:predicted nicotinamide N-methyase
MLRCGQITTEYYETGLLPAPEKRLQHVKINAPHFMKRNKGAMVPGKKSLKAVTRGFDFIVPGEARTFLHGEKGKQKNGYLNPKAQVRPYPLWVLYAAVRFFAFMVFPLQVQQFFIQDRCVQLCVPDPGAVQKAYQKGEIPFPYWSKVWPAAIGLGEFLCNHPYYIQNKKVLELAAGLGLPSVMAARSAASVLSTDYMPGAVEAIQRSAEHNGLKNITAALLDWRSLSPLVDADVLLVSDINYDPALFNIQHRQLNLFLQRGTTIILSTPQRLMGKEFIVAWLPFCKHREELTVNDSGSSVLISVLVLQQ